jgi:prevent-host-death family protein
MTAVSITELKARLSHYLREVRRGGEVQILDRGRPIALLVGVPTTGDENSRARLRLIRAGVLRAGGGATHTVLSVAPLKVPEGLSGALADDRADRI